MSASDARMVRSAGRLKVAPGSIAAWLALSAVFVTACARSDRETSPADAAIAVPSPVVNGPMAPPISGPAAVATPGAQYKGEPGTSIACNADSDCRTFSDACSVCSCRPFAKTSPDPKCAGKLASCLVDPCTGLGVYCRKGTCTLGGPGDAASGATPAGRADASSADAAKGAGSAAPAHSSARKSTDAARD